MKSPHKLTSAQEAEDRGRVERELLEMSLREMREMVGKNQVDVAAAVETTQSELSPALSDGTTSSSRR
jgi:hypothetical protein